MKKVFFLILILLILIPSQLFALDINCPTGILIDATTGRILYEKNMNEKSYPASTTKILTAILVLENCNLDDEVTASYTAVMSVPVGGSNAAIQVGETLTVRELLQALLVQSANEAANILAEHISGSVPEFASLLNKRATELGATNTNFVNANGLHNANHYSTVHDMSLFAKYAMEHFPEFREIVSTIRFRLPITNKYSKDDRFFLNTNQMLVPNNASGAKNYYYEYTTGIKTGYTSQAGNCLVASASKEGIDLIAVVFGGKQSESGVSYRYTDVKSMFNYGFDTLVINTLKEVNTVIETKEIPNAKKDSNTLDIVLEKDIKITMNREDLTNVPEPVIKMNELSAPIKKGDIVGTITYTMYNTDYTSNLLANQNIEKKSNLFAGFFKAIGKPIFIILILFTTLFCIRIYNKSKARKRKKYLYDRYR